MKLQMVDLSGQYKKIQKAVDELQTIAQETTNNTNKKGYEAFSNLTLNQKKKIISNGPIQGSLHGIKGAYLDQK